MNTERLKSWLSSSSKLVAASAQLAKKQAELTTLNNVTLPRLYHAIGKRIIGSTNLPPDLQPHRDKIRELEAAIATKPEEPKSEPASGFTAKAKHLAQQAASKTAKATADAAASMKIQAAYVALGRQAIEKYGQKALPQEIREQYEAAMQKQTALATDVVSLNAAPGRRLVTPSRLLYATAFGSLVFVGAFLSRNRGTVPDRTSVAPTAVSNNSVQPQSSAEKAPKNPQNDSSASTTDSRASKKDAVAQKPFDPATLHRFTREEALSLLERQSPTGILSVSGAKRLSVEAAEVLAACPANLSFDDLVFLDDDAALALLRNRGTNVTNAGLRCKTSLSLRRLLALPDGTAIALGRGPWESLAIHGRGVRLSDSAAAGLAMFRGELSLLGVDADLFGQSALGSRSGGLFWLGGPESLQSAELVRKLCESYRQMGSSERLILDCRTITQVAAEALGDCGVGLAVRMTNLESVGQRVAELLLQAHDKGVDLTVGGSFTKSAYGTSQKLVDACK